MAGPHGRAYIIIIFIGKGLVSAELIRAINSPRAMAGFTRRELVQRANFVDEIFRVF